jgi:alpha-glucuronidase
MASIGINAVAINNVNVHRSDRACLSAASARTREDSGCVERLGDRLYLSVNFAAPLTMGEMDTADPLDRGS